MRGSSRKSTIPTPVRSVRQKHKRGMIPTSGSSRVVAELPFRCRPNRNLAETKVPDATPGIIAIHALTDKQALLAKLRYNRLIDIFTGVTCYSLQSHLRTNLQGRGQIETDELYIGFDRRGVHYVFPVEAQSARERPGEVQIVQDLQMCKARFPGLICRPIGAQFMEDDLIALFGFEEAEGRIRIVTEKHYRLLPQEKMFAR